MNKTTIRQQSHCFYDCKYHIVWTPKYRGKVMKEKYIKQEVRRMIRMICKWKGYEIMEGTVCDDHVHICIVIPPKYSISYAMSIIKGKSSAWIKKKNKMLKKRSDKGSFWARGYYVSTIGLDEWKVRRYVKHQEKHNQVQYALPL